jgi:hypothetical protein
MPITGKTYAVTTTATKLTTALGLDTELHCKAITIKNAKGATANAYAGDPTVASTNAWAELDANQSITWYSGEGWLCGTDEVFVVGTVAAPNSLFITVIY